MFIGNETDHRLQFMTKFSYFFFSKNDILHSCQPQMLNFMNPVALLITILFIDISVYNICNPLEIIQ